MEDSRILKLKERAVHTVCKYCGSKLHLKRIVFHEINEAHVELYCENCERIEYGVEQEVYQCAKNIVEELQFDYYADLEKTEQVKRMNIAKCCDVITYADVYRGFCDDSGFQVPVTTAADLDEGVYHFNLDNRRSGD